MKSALNKLASVHFSFKVPSIHIKVTKLKVNLEGLTPKFKIYDFF